MKRKPVSNPDIIVPIHTTVKGYVYNKLLIFGEGFLNFGIEKAIEIAEGKQYSVKKELERVANQILNEQGDK